MKKLLTLLCIFALFAFTGCSDGDTFTAKSYSSGEIVIESVSIDVTDRLIDISVSDDNRVHIEYFDGEKEYFGIDVSENGVLTVKLLFNKQWTDFIGVKASSEYRNVSVKLPATVKTLFVSTTNKKIKLNSLSFADSVTLTNNGGDICFEKLSVGTAFGVTAKNGNIVGTVAGSYDDFSINCAIKKGESNLPAEKIDGDKVLKANCNNGDINIKFVKGKGE